MIEKSRGFDLVSYAIMAAGLVLVVLPFWIVIVASSLSLQEVSRVPLPLWPSAHMWENLRNLKPQGR